MSVIDDFNELTKDLTLEQCVEKREEYRVKYPELWKYWSHLIGEKFNENNSKTPQG